MDTITFRCTACKFVLKVGADKAGRNAKCSKCGTVLTIPARSDAAPAAAAAPPAKKAADEEGDQTYGLKEDAPEPVEERRKQEDGSPPKVLKKPGRALTKKQAQITNPDDWRKVAFGARIIAVGLCMWLAGYLLYRVPLVLGMAEGEEFAAAADKRLVKSPIESGQAPDLDICAFAVGIIAGNSWAGLMLLVVRLSLILFLVLYGPLLAGYVICLVVPNRFGTRLQLKVLIGLALVNALVLVIFKMLPMFGVSRYTILPLVMPEVAMLEMNGERIESLVTFWSKWPIIDVYVALLLTLLNYLEPAMIARFLHAVGKSVKSEELEAKSLAAMKLGYSQIFIQLAWLMASLCGTSLVLLWSLRFVYTIGAGFFIYQLIYTIALLFGLRGVIEDQLGDEAPEKQ